MTMILAQEAWPSIQIQHSWHVPLDSATLPGERDDLPTQAIKHWVGWTTSESVRLQRLNAAFNRYRLSKGASGAYQRLLTIHAYSGSVRPRCAFSTWHYSRSARAATTAFATGSHGLLEMDPFRRDFTAAAMTDSFYTRANMTNAVGSAELFVIFMIADPTHVPTQLSLAGLLCWRIAHTPGPSQSTSSGWIGVRVGASRAHQVDGRCADCAVGGQ